LIGDGKIRYITAERWAYLVVIRKKSENVTDVSAFSSSLRTNRNPLSVSVNDNQEIWKLIKGVPGSFHINIATSERTNRIGRRLQPNNLLTGNSDSQYIANTATYNPVSNTMF
jgi:hypothetical protein